VICMRGAGIDLSRDVILIIEDEPIHAWNLQIALEEAGADVVVGPTERVAPSAIELDDRVGSPPSL
jgi:DNA-binding NtrC family response regulator